MQIEMNLLDYMYVILRGWRIVLVVFVATAAVATLFSFLQPSVYEASVTLMEQSYEFLAAPQLASIDRTIVRLYPALALSEVVEGEVIEALGPNLSAGEKTPGALLDVVTIEQDRDNPGLFQIKAQAGDPQKAMQIANTWARQYLQLVSGLQAGWSSQLEVVEQKWKSASEAMATFQQETGLGLISDPGEDEAYIVLGARGLELERKARLLAEHEEARDNLVLLLHEAQQAKEAGGSVGDLPLQLLNTPVIVDRGQLSVESLRELEDLDTIIALLEAEQEIVSDVIDQLAGDVEQLEGELVRDQAELDLLNTEKTVARAAYTALTDQVKDAQLFQNRTQIVSPATTSDLVAPNRKLNILLGAALGLAGGVLAAFAAQYLRAIRQGAQG